VIGWPRQPARAWSNIRPSGESLEQRSSYNIRSMGFAAALTVAIGFTLSGQAARADDCDDIVDELKKLTERVINTSEPRGVGPVCAATGQLLGSPRRPAKSPPNAMRMDASAMASCWRSIAASRRWKARSTPCASESGHGSIGEA